MSAKVVGQGSNWYSVALTLKNTGVTPIDAPTIGWHFNWADHSAPATPEIDYASVAGTSKITEERDDFSGTVWVQVPNTLAQGDSAVVHLRLHTSDHTPIDANNDPSWLAMPESGVTVRSGGVDYLAAVPRLPFPTIAKQEASVQTLVMQKSTTTLGLRILVKNTGEVPLHKVRFTWFADTLASESPMVAEIDWSQVAGATVTKRVIGGRIAFEFALGDGLLPIGATREIQVRLHSMPWANINFEDDWSWQGVNVGTTNPQVQVTSDGLVVAGRIPSALDSDGDGVPDAVEVQVGHDPFSASDKPLVGIPDRVVIGDVTEKQYVTYDFSAIPGYENSSRIAVPVNPGTLADNMAPSIEYLGDTVQEPEHEQREYIRIGGYFRVHAEIVPDQQIEMAIPKPDYAPKSLDIGHVTAHRFDVAAQEWQPLTVVGVDQAIHVSTKKFSVVDASMIIQPRSIAAGESHIVVYDSVMSTTGEVTSRVLTAGIAADGRLGIPQGNLAFYDSLVQVWGLPSNIRSVAAGARHSLALTLDGKVYAWGDNANGQLGIGTTGDTSWMPVLVKFPAGTQIINLSVGAEHNAAQDVTGKIWVWGRGTEGQLGLESASGVAILENKSMPEILPARVDGGNTYKFTEVACGKNHTVAMDDLDRPWSWGKNDAGQLLIPVGKTCEDYLTWDGIYQKTGAAECTYKTDANIHAPGRRTFQGFGKRFEAPVNQSQWRIWGRFDAGSNFALTQRYNTLGAYGGLTVAWGGGMQEDLTNVFGPTLMSGGYKHYLILRQGGFVSDVKYPESAGYTLVEERVENGATVYVYRYSELVSVGDNTTLALGVTSKTERYSSKYVRDLDDIAAGNGFSALWFPSQGVAGRVKIIGKMGDKNYGANGEFVSVIRSVPTVKVEITSPVEGTVLPINGEVPVTWKVNDVLQTAYTWKVPTVTQDGQSVPLIISYSDQFGATGADTVNVIAKALNATGLSVSGNLEYHAENTALNTMLTVSMVLSQPAKVNLVAIDPFTSAVVCRFGDGLLKTNGEDGKYTTTWNGYCNDGAGGANTSWMPEGVFGLQVELERFGAKSLLSYTNPASIVTTESRTYSMEYLMFTPDIGEEMLERYSNIPSNTAVVLTPMVYGIESQRENQYLISIHAQTWLNSLGCIKPEAEDKGGVYRFKKRIYQIDARSITAQLFGIPSVYIGITRALATNQDVVSATYDSNYEVIMQESGIELTRSRLQIVGNVVYSEWDSFEGMPWIQHLKKGIQLKYKWHNGLIKSNTKCINLR